jgi:hypothetical protein
VAADMPWFGSSELVITVVVTFNAAYEGEEAEEDGQSGKLGDAHGT